MVALVGEHLDGRSDFPSFLVGGQHPTERLQVLELPGAVDFDVLVFVAGSDPHLAWPVCIFLLAFPALTSYQKRPLLTRSPPTLFSALRHSRGREEE